MQDTQWPRFQVFVQDRSGSPFIDAGSVHAPDPEMALLNARDVFARRPECVGMWVVPVPVIFSRTNEEIQAGGIQPYNREAPDPEHGQFEEYLVFNKAKPAGTQTQVGMVTARSAQEALEIALARFHQQPTPPAWWVIPAASIIRSDPRDIPSFFEPARDKSFRLSADFRTVSAMRTLRGSGTQALSESQPTTSSSEDTCGI